MTWREQICPTCGRPMPPVFDGVVTGAKRRRTVELIAQRPGITNRELATLIYADDPDGGPVWAASCVSLFVHVANKQLKPHGYRIKSTFGRGAGYRLVPL